MSKQNGSFIRTLAVAPVVIMIFAAGVYSQAIEISSFEDLGKIGVDAGYPLDGDYELTADIDASESRELDGGLGFAPIGRRVARQEGLGEVVDPAAAFTGRFDGKGHTVSGLYINRANLMCVGLFGYAHGAEIRGVSVVADSVVGDRYVGALIGRAGGGTITGCRAGGTVVGDADVGGLAGAIERVDESADTLASSYSSADVTGNSMVGGLVGSNAGSVISGCYSFGTVNVVGAGGQRVGGLVGYNTGSGAKVSNSYSMTAISGAAASAVGGFAGESDGAGGAQITMSYSAGAVAGGDGFVGNAYGPGLSFCFFDTERSGQTAAATGVTGKTSAEMRRAATYSGWFTATSLWAVADNYPYLKDLPFYTITFTAAQGGTVGGGSVHVQAANYGVDGAPVVAAVSDSAGGDSLTGWYLPGEDDKLIAGGYDGFTAALSDGGDTITLSGLTGDVDIEARFSLKTYRLTYVAGANGRVRADTAGADSATDTLVFFVGHGQLGPSVRAVPDTAYRFFRWSWDNTNPLRADTAWKDTTFKADFTGDTLKLRYLTSNRNLGRLRSNDASTYYDSVSVPKIAYGAIGPKIDAEPFDSSYIRFVKWDDGSTANPRVDTARVDLYVKAIFAIKTYALTYTAGEGGKVVAAVADSADTVAVFSDTVEYNKSGPNVTAVPDSGYVFVGWSDSVETDSRVDSLVRKDINVTAVFESIPIAVKSADRVIPNTAPGNEWIVVNPLTITAGKFTAGPNPASRQHGPIKFSRNGRGLDNGTLFIYDATGNAIKRIDINDNIIDSHSSNRQVASWDLTDGNGKPVSAGTYLVRGTLSTRNGTKERVLLILGVR